MKMKNNVIKNRYGIIKRKKSKWKIALLILLSILIMLGIGTMIYLSDYYHSEYTLEEYRQKYNTTITEANSIISIKGDNDNSIGIIFYPGGKVEYTAYIPLLELLAERGYTCFIPKMPGNLAVFGINKADDVIKENPDIKKWYIAGHSLGGAMASSYASKNSDKLEGIMFLGAYPSSDLSTTKLKMLSIVGSNDKIVNRENYEKTKTNAPEGAIYKTLEGGNHADYGDYGAQAGDGIGTISREEQMQKAAHWMDEFCNESAKDNSNGQENLKNKYYLNTKDALYSDLK